MAYYDKPNNYVGGSYNGSSFQGRHEVGRGGFVNRGGRGGNYTGRDNQGTVGQRRLSDNFDATTNYDDSRTEVGSISSCETDRRGQSHAHGVYYDSEIPASQRVRAQSPYNDVNQRRGNCQSDEKRYEFKGNYTNAPNCDCCRHGGQANKFRGQNNSFRGQSNVHHAQSPMYQDNSRSNRSPQVDDRYEICHHCGGSGKIRINSSEQYQQSKEDEGFRGRSPSNLYHGDKNVNRQSSGRRDGGQRFNYDPNNYIRCGNGVRTDNYRGQSCGYNDHQAKESYKGDVREEGGFHSNKRYNNGRDNGKNEKIDSRSDEYRQGCNNHGFNERGDGCPGNLSPKAQCEGGRQFEKREFGAQLGNNNAHDNRWQGEKNDEFRGQSSGFRGRSPTSMSYQGNNKYENRPFERRFVDQNLGSGYNNHSGHPNYGNSDGGYAGRGNYSNRGGYSYRGSFVANDGYSNRGGSIDHGNSSVHGGYSNQGGSSGRGGFIVSGFVARGGSSGPFGVVGQGKDDAGGSSTTSNDDIGSLVKPATLLGIADSNPASADNKLDSKGGSSDEDY